LLVCLLACLFVDLGSHYVVQSDLQLMILPLQPPKF
jgi:hypothetical protein